jgi:tetratricopeptide (TPR) repeat protein
MLPTLALVLTLVQAAPDASPTPPAPASAAPAASAKDKAAARALLREGTRLFSKGKHQDALDRFNRAYALFPSPKLLYNIAQANRELGHPVEALAAFEGFLAQVDKPPARLAADVRRSVAELQAQLGELQIQVDVTGAEVSLDGKPLGVAPLSDSVWVTPGAHEIAARKDGFLPAKKAVDARAGGAEQVAIKLPPLMKVAAVSTEPIPPHAVPPIYKRTWFWVAVGAAVVAGTVAAVAWTAGGGKPVNSMP